jgi:predicted PhzF superfamily epimerase YddE/YHI9
MDWKRINRHNGWFTPPKKKAEVDLCDHATLATAFTLFTKLGYNEEHFVFDSKSGPLTVLRFADGRMQLDFPSRPAIPATLPVALFKGLGATPKFYAKAEANRAGLETQTEILALKPDFATLATLEQYGTIATAPGDDCDFVSRFFAPRVGVPEDPVTGSAQCVLTPYWSD